jgi:tRNA (guanine37-N1)-methyltransferase
MNAKGLYVVLMHGPVLGQNGEEICTATTPMDVSDIARSCRTFGVQGYALVQPDINQRAIIERMASFWRKKGDAAIRSRVDALARIETFDSLASVFEQWGEGVSVATSANAGAGSIDHAQILAQSQSKRVYLIFGTGYGLTEETMAQAQEVAPAIQGVDDYAHLSVRSAVAIILDRIHR